MSRLACILAAFIIIVNGLPSDAVASTPKDTTPSTTSIHVVYVPGSPDCEGIFSDYCGWGSWGGDPYDGNYYADGEVGGGSSTSYPDDGSTGKEMKYNRTVPGCYREYLAMVEAQSQQGSSNPLGIRLPLTINDPAYPEPGWIKISIPHYESRWDRNTNQTLEWRTEVHYLYNTNSFNVAQVKMKQSYEYGCAGITK